MLFIQKPYMNVRLYVGMHVKIKEKDSVLYFS